MIVNINHEMSKKVNDVGPGTLFLCILKILFHCVLLCIAGEKS